MSENNLYPQLSGLFIEIANKVIDERIKHYTYRPEVELESLQAWEELYMQELKGNDLLPHVTFRQFLDFLGSFLAENAMANFDDFLDGWNGNLYLFIGTAQEFLAEFERVADWTTPIDPLIYPNVNISGTNIDFYYHLYTEFIFGEQVIYPLAIERGEFADFENEFNSLISF